MTSGSGAELLPVAGYDLPGGREVVGRGLQLAYDASAEIRRASLYVGLLLFALAGPALVVLIADIPRLRDFPFADPTAIDAERAREFVSIFGSLSILATIALLGFVTVSIDGTIMAVTILAGRAVGRPVTLRQALRRARQVFWRYGAAMFVVGIVSQVASTLVGIVAGPARSDTSTGAALLSVFAGTLATAPFGYVAAGIIVGDVDAGTALRRSITLARARPRLAAVVATFAFLAGVLELFGVGAAVDTVGRIVEFQHLSIDPASGDVLVALPLIAVALIALGSLGLTVAAVVAAPQVVAFLGLTHYSAGLDRVASPPPAAADLAPQVEPSTSAWARGAEPRAERFRWVTIPMLGLIAFAIVVTIGGLIAAA